MRGIRGGGESGELSWLSERVLRMALELCWGQRPIETDTNDMSPCAPEVLGRRSSTTILRMIRARFKSPSRTTAACRRVS